MRRDPLRSPLFTAGPREYWPALRADTREMTDEELRFRAHRWWVLALLYCVVPAVLVWSAFLDVHARLTRERLTARIVDVRPGFCGKDGACFDLALTALIGGRPVAGVSERPHRVPSSWSAPVPPPRPGEDITVLVDPAEPARMLPASALMTPTNYVMMTAWCLVLGVLPLTWCLIRRPFALAEIERRRAKALAAPASATSTPGASGAPPAAPRDG